MFDEQVVIWLRGVFGGKSADTNVTEDHEHLRDHEPAMMRANWSTGPEPERKGGGRIDEAAGVDETSRTPSWARRKKEGFLALGEIWGIADGGGESRRVEIFHVRKAHMTKGQHTPCHFEPSVELLGKLRLRRWARKCTSTVVHRPTPR